MNKALEKRQRNSEVLEQSIVASTSTSSAVHSDNEDNFYGDDGNVGLESVFRPLSVQERGSDNSHNSVLRETMESPAEEGEGEIEGDGEDDYDDDDDPAQFRVPQFYSPGEDLRAEDAAAAASSAKYRRKSYYRGSRKK